MSSSSASNANYSLKEEIRAYWSLRAATFDESYGHAIKSDRELEAFQNFFRAALGEKPLDVLDLACGTGEITWALLSLDHRVTGLDFSEPMIALAKAKHGSRAKILFGDVEKLLDDDARYDALVTRHLVWTLTDPEAAFAEWFRVLRPGGKLVVIDGDWINRTRWQKAMNALAAKLRLFAGGAGHGADRETFNSIASRFYFKDGLTPQKLDAMLRKAGFASTRPLDYRPILRAQQASAPWHDALQLGSFTRFGMVALKA